MPATRKSARSTVGAGKQSTLKLNNRVTKSVAKSSKDKSISSPFSQETRPAKKQPRQVVDDEAIRGSGGEEESRKCRGKTGHVLEAEKTSDKAIERYWCHLEAQRTAKRVHNDQLSTGEKVLRYFDVSSQYGPCIGIRRVKRWERAQRLGLNPPVEVLAILLKGEAEGKDVQKAHMDELMNSTVAAPT